VLRDTATRLHLVGRRSRRLTTTRRGLLLATDPAALFHQVATTLACEGEYLAMLSELVAHRLFAGPAVGHALERIVGPVIVAQGWRAIASPRRQRVNPLRILQVDPVVDLQLGPLGLTLLRQRATIAA
jgi:hypothetical protein